MRKFSKIENQKIKIFKNASILRSKPLQKVGWYVCTFLGLKTLLGALACVLERVLFYICDWIFKKWIFC